MNYYAEKASVREELKELEYSLALRGYGKDEVIELEAIGRKLMKRYGLIREFRARGYYPW